MNKPAKVTIVNKEVIRLFSLNAKAIKKAMIQSFIDCKKVYQVKSGTSKGASYITVSTKDANKATDFFRNLGVVDCMGGEIKFCKCSSDVVTFDAVYMCESMFLEINE